MIPKLKGYKADVGGGEPSLCSAVEPTARLNRGEVRIPVATTSLLSIEKVLVDSLMDSLPIASFRGL